MTAARRAAIAASGRFLLAGQSADGAWRDFATGPGVADAWTTAYVGLALIGVPPARRPEGCQAALVRAAGWLARRTDRTAGWGYNGKCPADADSTAHAILFLRHCGQEVPASAYARLWSFRRPDGGFTTYLGRDGTGSWGVSHPCVTPVAVHAMLSAMAPDDPRLAPSLERIRGGQSADGLWPSFWWSTPLYSTARNLEAAVELELAFDPAALTAGLGALTPETPFELSLLLRCLAALGRRRPAAVVAERLALLQAADGSWPSTPILRVTRRSCFAPWADPDPGPLHADQHRLFTTATALAALAAAAARGGE